MGLSSVFSLFLSFSVYVVCWERKREYMCTNSTLSHTLSHTISCCSITGGWILFIMAWRSCFLLHSIGLPCKPAYALSNCNDMLLFVQDYTRIYMHDRNFVFFWSTFALPHYTVVFQYILTSFTSRLTLALFRLLVSLSLSSISCKVTWIMAMHRVSFLVD